MVSVWVAIIFLAPAVFADPQIERSESSLIISWYSSSSGNWNLMDNDGHYCASGRMRVGINEINFPKIDATSVLQFAYTSSSTSNNEFRTDIPAAIHLSQLAKPEGAAVIYQLPPRTYLATGAGKEQSGRLDALTSAKLRDIKDLGADYLWLTGIQEHASLEQTDPDVVKGDAGSYYAIYDNWDVSGIIGDLASFESLIVRSHDAGLRVLMDFIPNHTARSHHTDVICKQEIDFGENDDSSRFFVPTNNYFYLSDAFTPPSRNANGADGIFDTDIFRSGIQREIPARVTGNDITSPRPQNRDWFETVKLNYGWDFGGRQSHYDPVPRTWQQMLDVARYWILKGVDGFRVDYAHAVPIEFWQFFVQNLRDVQPELFLLAEAYEKDERMKVPGFSYQAILAAGFDSVYNSDIYWGLHHEASNPGNVQAANANRSPAMRREIIENGYLLTHYMENHDEERVASRHFAPWVSDRAQRANIGLAYSTYSALLPGNMLIHGGQELQEDASVYGEYAGDNGRTSIFDFIYQAFTRTWVYGQRPNWMVEFRQRYKNLLALKHLPAFAKRHRIDDPSFIDLDGANFYKEQARFIASYVRFDGDGRYLVVLNSDPFNSHRSTIHMTAENGQDHLGVLNALGIENSDTRILFTEVFSRAGWVPTDPEIDGPGIPGWALYKSGGVPSGLFLGEVAPGTALVFKITEL
jgi:glycosidase